MDSERIEELLEEMDVTWNDIDDEEGCHQEDEGYLIHSDTLKPSHLEIIADCGGTVQVYLGSWLRIHDE